MGQLIFFAVIGAVALYGYRSFKREAARVSARVRQAEKEAQNRAMGTRVRDPETGEYRLPKD
jgi:hypothetical protein